MLVLSSANIFGMEIIFFKFRYYFQDLQVGSFAFVMQVECTSAHTRQGCTNLGCFSTLPMHPFILFSTFPYTSFSLLLMIFHPLGASFGDMRRGSQRKGEGAKVLWTIGTQCKKHKHQHTQLSCYEIKIEILKLFLFTLYDGQKTLHWFIQAFGGRIKCHSLQPQLLKTVTNTYNRLAQLNQYVISWEQGAHPRTVDACLSFPL